jgi:hypothetical protein
MCNIYKLKTVISDMWSRYAVLKNILYKVKSKAIPITGRGGL